MRSLEQINRDNQSDGKPMLDTHPDQPTLGLPMRTGQGEQDDISGRVITFTPIEPCSNKGMANGEVFTCIWTKGHEGDHLSNEGEVWDNYDPFYPTGDRW